MEVPSVVQGHRMVEKAIGVDSQKCGSSDGAKGWEK